MEIVEQIYEAAFQPDVWRDVLHHIAERTESVGGIIQVSRGGGVAQWVASAGVRPAFQAYADRGDWSATYDRASRWLRRGQTFLRDIDLFDGNEIDQDPARHMLIGLGLGWQSGAILQLPTGDVGCFTIERGLSQGAHSLADVQYLDSLLPHLSRAGLIAARMELEQARSQVAALELLGLPAAVLRADGRLLAANPALEAMTDTVVVLGAFDRVAFADRVTNPLLVEALEAMRQTGTARSIPIRANTGRPPMVAHLLPLLRTARGMFHGGHAVLVLTRLASSRMVPDQATLTGLFDLTPSEARLAAALSGGASIAEAAAAMGLTVKTVRTYLERVFQKTATHQQSELVALLKSAPTVGLDLGRDAS